MRRLYYVADRVDDAEAVCLAMHREGVGHWRLHVLAKDAAGLYTHHIHSANPIHQLDIVHTALRFAVVGGAIGLLIGCAIFAMSSFDLLPFAVPVWLIFAAVAFGICFGAWEGGLVGLSRENYKIERFHEDIEQGKYVLMVDVDDELRPKVKAMMNFDFPQVPYRGAGKRFINPLEKPKVLYHQTTH